MELVEWDAETGEDELKATGTQAKLEALMEHLLSDYLDPEAEYYGQALPLYRIQPAQ